MALAFSIEWFSGYTLRRLLCQQCRPCWVCVTSWRSATEALAQDLLFAGDSPAVEHERQDRSRWITSGWRIPWGMVCVGGRHPI